MPPNANPPQAPPAHPPPAPDRTLFAALASLSIQLAFLAIAALASALAAQFGQFAAHPIRPLTIALASLLFAYVSLVSLACLRWQVSTYLRLLAGLFAGMLLWSLLMRVFAQARADAVVSACWATSIALQMSLTAAAAYFILPNRSGKNPRAQFSIGHLIAATTALALLLGALRWKLEQAGASLPGALSWQFAQHVLWMGIANAVLASAMLLALHRPRTWPERTAATAVLIGAFSILAPLLMDASFRNVGAPALELFALWFGQGITLAAVLIPIQLVERLAAE